MWSELQQSFDPSIVEDSDYLSLGFGSRAVQSKMLKSAPAHLVLAYLRAMPLALLLNPSAHKVLNLGLGGGVLHRYLRTQEFCRLDVTSIETNVQVIELARNRFGLSKSEAIVHADAEGFLRQDQDSYDIVFCDLCTDQGMPGCMRQESFYRHCRKRLLRGGIMAVNLLSDDKEELLPILLSMRRHLPSGYLLPIRGHGNTLVFAGYSPLRDVATLRGSANSASDELKLDLGEAVDSLVALPPSPDPGQAKAARCILDSNLPGR